MTLKRGYYLIIMVFILTGCFRQASEPSELVEGQSVSNTAAPVPTTDPGEVEPTPIIPVTQSTPVIPPTTPPTDEPIQQPTDVEPTLDSATQDPGGGVNTVPLDSPTPTPPPPTPITPLPPGGTSAVTTPTPIQQGPTATATPSGLVTPTVDSAEVVDECTYVVQPGDNLFRISINNNVTLDALRAANPQIVGDIIQPGDRIAIPDCQPEAAAPDAGTGDAGTTTDGGVASGGTVHVVQAGETLAIIARNYGVTITAIAEANGLENPNQLSIGQELVIPN